MNRILLITCLCLLSFTAMSQITITASDMPVINDTLRYSIALGATSGINVNDSGTNKTWVYDTLRPVGQSRADYKSAISVSPLYAIISPTAYGYKIADSIPGIGSAVPGLTINDIYTFFNKKTSPSRYIAEGFGAKVSGAPVPAVYSDEEEIYFFPLTYPHATDSSTFAVTVSIPLGPLTGSYSRKGYRKTRVDGWGTIKTPYYTTAVSCIRVRSDIHEIDSIIAPAPLSLSLGIPLDSIEYKWLVNGGHYPALWVMQSKHTGALTSVTYRDSVRHGLVGVSTSPQLSWHEIKAYPNPITNGMVQLELPAGWSNFTVFVYDVTGKIIADYKNKTQFNIQSLAAGKYTILVKNNTDLGITQIIKQ